MLSAMEIASFREMFLKYQLLISAKNGAWDMIKALSKYPDINLNCKDEDGRTPLHLAVINMHPELVEVLVTDSRVDPNLEDKYGRRPLHYLLCYEKENEEIIYKMYAFLLRCPRIDVSDLLSDATMY